MNLRIPILSAVLLLVLRAGAAEPAPFDPGTPHGVLLRFSPDQWRMLEPKERDLLAEDQADGRDEYEFGFAHADLVFDGTTVTNVAVRYKGHGTYRQSRSTLKRPFKVDLNQFVRGQRIGGFSKLNFNNNVLDRSYLSEALGYRLYREAKVPAPRTAHARLEVEVPGVVPRRLLGLYTLVENPDATWTEAWLGSRKVLVLKPTSDRLFEYRGPLWESYREHYAPKSTVHEAQADRVIEFSRFLAEADDARLGAGLGGFLDLEEFARFMAVTVAASSLDSVLGPSGNLIVCLDPASRRFVFAPWDLDQAFGGMASAGTREQRERLSILRPWIGTNRFLERVFSVEAFRRPYRDRLREIAEGAFEPGRFAAELAPVVRALRPVVAEEGPEGLRRFDEAVGVDGSGGSLQAFVAARRASILAQLGGADPGLRIAPGPAAGDGGATNLLARALRRLDADADGAVTRAEWGAAMDRWFVEWAGAPNRVLRMEAILDGMTREFGGEGGVDPDRLRAAAARWTSAFDLDRSGAVSRGEFAGGLLGRFLAWDLRREGRLPTVRLAGLLEAELGTATP